VDVERGALARERGDHGRAQRALDRALDAATERDARLLAAGAHLELGLLDEERGSLRRARSQLSTAAETYREGGATPALGRTASALADVCEGLGEDDAATEWHETARRCRDGSDATPE
jgi:tetratricopeptide (TPR) repeat protein